MVGGTRYGHGYKHESILLTLLKLISCHTNQKTKIDVINLTYYT